ncbi:MAG: 7-carboxy-7-deazaguanine synthase QueE [bacterium]|nr:7-carboxy-7-deazaguanine synthase QueE [bacterium]
MPVIMPDPGTLKINEIFWSFQGEGTRMGIPSIFLRMGGCTVGCPYCDTKYAWKKGTDMTVETITAAIGRYMQNRPLSQVVLTGGEPLEQDLSAIASTLKEQRFFLSIETSGSFYQPLPIDWWTVAPKDVCDYAIHPGLVNHVDEIKLVVNDNLTMDVIRNIRETVKKVPVFLQPYASNPQRYPRTFSLFRECQEAGLANIRCGVQLHTIYQVQ